MATTTGAFSAPAQEIMTKSQNTLPSDRIRQSILLIRGQLTRQEKTEVVANCDHLGGLKFSAVPPRAFTEHGAIMLAAVLNSPVAIHASVQIVRAFVQLREILSGHRDLADKLAALERRYDHQFKVVFDAIRELMIEEHAPKKEIGFKASSRR